MVTRNLIQNRTNEMKGHDAYPAKERIGDRYPFLEGAYWTSCDNVDFISARALLATGDGRSSCRMYAAQY
jgi:hypothetical protein